MDMDEIKQSLDTLVETIETDSLLDDDLRTELLELAQEALGDPTPDNLRALSIVLERLGESEKYMNALDVVAGV